MNISMSEEFIEKLVGMYRFIKANPPETVIDEIFGMSELKFHISDIIEDIYKDYFIYKKLGPKELLLKEYVIFLYDDEYDFINTLSNIDDNDLFIFFEQQNIRIFVMDMIKILNKTFNRWIQGKTSGYRKGCKIFFEMRSDRKIRMLFKPDLNLKKN